MPDPKVVHREPIQPFVMCLDNIFDRGQFNEQKKKAEKKQHDLKQKGQHLDTGGNIKYAKTGFSTQKQGKKGGAEDPYGSKIPRSQSIAEMSRKDKRALDLMGK